MTTASEGTQGGVSPVAIITGAGSGMGLATARLLREAGYALVLAARRADALEQAAADLRSVGPAALPVLCVPTDIARHDEVKRLIDTARERLGRIDVLINNAGLARLIPIGRNTKEEIDAVYATNALGPAYAIALAWPVFEAQRRGCVVNISTKGTADPFPGFFAYAAAKSAVNSMVRSCAKEGARIGVRAFAVAPGAVETGMLRSMFSEKSLPPAACLRPEDVAGLVLDCIAGRRDADNGRTIFVRRGEDGSVSIEVK